MSAGYIKDNKTGTPETTSVVPAATAAKTSPQKIAIYVTSANGFGDLIFGYRLANTLRAKFPKMAIHIVAHSWDINSSSPIHNHAFDTLGIPKTDIYDIKTVNFSQYATVIIGPGVRAISETAQSQIDNSNVLLVSEYDCIEDSNELFALLKTTHAKEKSLVQIKSGLSAGAHGILLEQRLLADTKHSPQDAWGALSAPLKAQLLGKGKPADYHKTTTFNLAYTSVLSSAQIPLLHAAHAAKREQPSHDLVVINKTHPFIGGRSDELISNMETYRDYLKTYLAKWGYTAIEVCYSGQSAITAIEQHSDVKPKKFRVLFTDKVSHTDMLALRQLAGNNFTTITGDQSLSEAISKGCPFFYRLVYFKVDLMKALIALAEKKPYTNLAKVLTNYFHHNQCQEQSIRTKQGDVIRQIIERDAELIRLAEAEFLALCKDIREQHNLGNRIAEEISVLLNLKPAEVQATATATTAPATAASAAAAANFSSPLHTSVSAAAPPNPAAGHAAGTATTPKPAPSGF